MAFTLSHTYKLGKCGKNSRNKTGYNGVQKTAGRKGEKPFRMVVTIQGKRISHVFDTARKAAVEADKIYIQHKMYHLLNILKPL